MQDDGQSTVRTSPTRQDAPDPTDCSDKLLQPKNTGAQKMHPWNSANPTHGSSSFAFSFCGAGRTCRADLPYPGRLRLFRTPQTCTRKRPRGSSQQPCPRRARGPLEPMAGADDFLRIEARLDAPLRQPPDEAGARPERRERCSTGSRRLRTARHRLRAETRRADHRRVTFATDQRAIRWGVAACDRDSASSCSSMTPLGSDFPHPLRAALASCLPGWCMQWPRMQRRIFKPIDPLTRVMVRHRTPGDTRFQRARWCAATRIEACP